MDEAIFCTRPLFPPFRPKVAFFLRLLFFLQLRAIFCPYGRARGRSRQEGNFPPCQIRRRRVSPKGKKYLCWNGGERDGWWGKMGADSRADMQP